ncbi:PHD finger family protein [Rhynchospora pubera]|uniref:PHD finger family protein n=1 Tax=Rhynchospora pubera TaxID=906938 RepID=A0AAV8FTM7_9POAL|nr:PHD finger family protein [Rhynchospora pubera]
MEAEAAGPDRRDESFPSEANADADADSNPGGVKSEITLTPPMEIESNGQESGTDRVLDSDCKKKEGECVVGCYVGRKEAGSGTTRVLLGKVTSYDAQSEVYCVVYEDGERENLDGNQLSQILVDDDGTGSRLKMSCRKRKLDLLVSEEVKKNPSEVSPGPQGSEEVKKNPSDVSNGSQASDVSDDADSSSNSCESSGRDLDSSEPVREIQVPELPPSSGDIAVPEESIGHLFSVYTFLRSFSVHLFLSPFTLADFVGSLNCSVKNSLLDVVHLSLMKALRRHLESLMSDGSQFASTCLRYHDWSLLDTLTWPVFLLEFLHLRGLVQELGGLKFGLCLSSGEYYGLPVSVKLKMLQILCDEVMSSTEMKSELEKREEYSEDLEYDSDGISNALPTESSTRRGRSRSARATSTTRETQEEPAAEKESSLSLDVGQDGNSDDCRICGMDGMLICCDGCPWAYHSRCIGLNKASLPQGQWFCPECTINKLGPISARIERGARGACYFGIDAAGRQFVGACDYLIVTRSLPGAERYDRYYNQSDVAKVFYVLTNTDERAHYADICKGISKYWDNAFCGIDNASVISLNEDAKCNGATPYNLKLQNGLSGLNVCTTTYSTPSNLKAQNSLSGLATDGSPLGTPSILKVQNSASGLAACTTPYVIAGKNSNAHGMSIETSKSIVAKSSARLGPTFKPYLYLNQYMHGDVAATAAATFAILSAEESNSKASDASNPRKVTQHMMILQMKAFSQAASQFVWPSADRRLMEVPRDRCGWCMSCKGPNIHKKGCLLNWAAANAIKGSARSLSSLRPIYRTEESNLPIVATYIASMEESLQGLTDGALLDAKYRDSWRNQLKEANDCKVLKFLLLELEKCIRGVALLSGWFKLLDEWSVELSGTTGGVSSRNSANQRRAGGSTGRRGKKRSGVAESTSGASDDKEVNWWRGGKLSKAVFQRGLLSQIFARKAARQGGVKKIPGISYHDSSEYPRRSRQFAWRVSVQSSKSTAQLALQVRYLNSQIRWKELVPPDQLLTEGKAAETDAAIFRNAVICDKKILENKILYALLFTNQKHLPVRVTKNVIEMEETDNSGGKLWFSENHIPLYLIKAYEEKARPRALLGLNTVIPTGLPIIRQKKRLQPYYTDIFMYLADRGQRHLKPPCASCKQQVLLRDIVRCVSCQGDCHEVCMGFSLSGIICKLCHAKCAAQPLVPKVIQIRQPMPLTPQQIQTVQKVEQVPGSNTKVKFLVGSSAHAPKQAVPAVPSTTAEPESKSGQKRKRQPAPGEPICYGLRFKREGKLDSGMDFRSENLVLKCKLVTNPSRQPICCLCQRPYSPDYIYIRCEKCLSWFHGDSVELKESQVDDLVGFKCGKCRRKVQPKCPFADPSSKKFKSNKVHDVRPSAATTHNNKPSEQSSAQPFHSSDDDLMLFHDPLLSSYGRVEPVEQIQNETSVGTQPDASQLLLKSNQKLSVRRAQTKNDSDLLTNSEIVADGAGTQATDSEDLNDVSVSSEFSSPILEWDFSHGDGFVGEDALPDANSNFAWTESNHENIDQGEGDDGFEPQTYFSFTELLAPEDNSLLDENQQIGASFDELLANSLQEDEPGSELWPETDHHLQAQPQPVFEDQVVVCDRCKGSDPAPDMSCEICRLCIHNYCSPWMESEESFGAEQWKCGNCREWR